MFYKSGAIQSTEYSHSIQVHEHEGGELCVQRSTFNGERSWSVCPNQDPNLLGKREPSSP